MSFSRSRATLIGLLAVVATGSLVSTAVYAAAGPFVHRRPIGSKGEGEKIAESAPEPFQGEGGQQRQVAKIASTIVEGVAESVQVKGIFYNNSLQGQLKMQLKFQDVHSVKPNLPECNIKIGNNNTAKVVGHLGWKWNGEKKQLEESVQSAQQEPVGVGLATELEAGAVELPNNVPFTTITYANKGCGVLGGVYVAKGSETIKTTPSHLEEWAKSLTLTLAEKGGEKLHFWNGKSQIGGETLLSLANEPATIGGESKASVTGQEIAVFEK
jgi:hypothetical protein